MNDRDNLDRGRMTTMEAEAPPPASRIVPLSDLHTHKVASGDPDVRGWPVVSGDGRTVGRVDGLLVDTVAMRVRYLDVILDLGPAEEAHPAAPLGAAGERHVLIPVGFARLGGSEDRIFVEGLPSDEAARLPAYDGGELTREAEAALLARFDRSSYDENRFYSVRRGRR